MLHMRFKKYILVQTNTTVEHNVLKFNKMYRQKNTFLLSTYEDKNIVNKNKYAK